MPNILKISQKTLCYGGILIEFAFSVPVVIILMYFVNDHYRFYELKNKTKTSAYLAASLTQQYGNVRANKQFTLADIQYISFASCLNFFHTDSMFTQGPLPFGVYYATYFRWCKRISSNQYQYQSTWTTTGGSGTFLKKVNAGTENAWMTNLNYVKQKHLDLECENDGDERLLIEIWYKTKHTTASQLGFWLMDISANLKGTVRVFIQGLKSTIVITPKPGLFPVAN